MWGKGNRYYLIGIVSYGYRCGEPGYPDIYTRVTAFLDWITSNLI
jgi:secreted trypsin-like serine protease